MDDYRVKAISNDELEKLAERWRRGFESTGIAELNPCDALVAAGAQFKDIAGLEIVVKNDVEMGRREAYATSPPPRIFVRKSVHHQALNNEPRAAFTLYHELAHLILHPGQEPKARIAQGNVTPAYIEPVHSAEHQANYFAAAFLMPRSKLAGMQSAAEIEREFGVSRKAAEIRFQQIVEASKVRHVPDAYVEFKRSVQLASQAENELILPEIAEAVWLKLDHAQGYDPDHHRLARGYLVARSEFNKMTPCGWFLEAEQARPFYMTDINLHR